MLRSSLLILVIGWYGLISVEAQINPVRQAISRMEKGKWESARQLLKKSLSKDSLNIESKLILSQWFITAENPAYHIDSAHYYALAALHDYAILEERLKERLKKFPIDSAILLANRQRVDSLAFLRAKNLNTEASYSIFIDQHRDSNYIKEAIELRDEVGYLEALRINTYISYKSYMDRYPNSSRNQEAKERYDRLLFEDRTKDNKVNSYKLFVRDFPTSPYQHQALQQIFEISTASGDRAAFTQFIEAYPQSTFARKAYDILFHRYKDIGQSMPQELLTDSLKEVIQLESKSWVPFLKNGLFGFLDSQGKERLSERFSNIDPGYLCGNVKDEILSTSEGLVSRSGKVISPPAQALNDIGSGFLLVEREGCKQLLHKSGRLVLNECVEEVAILNRRFIKVKTTQGVGLLALNGRKLTHGWRDILEKEGILLFDNHAKWLLATVQQVAMLADGVPLPTSLVFDQVQVSDQHQLLVRNGVLEGVLNNQLEFVVPLERQTLLPSAIGIIRKQNDIYNLSAVSKELEGLSVKRIDFSDRWMVLKEDENRILYDLVKRKVVERSVDSIWFDRKMAFALLQDSLSIHFQSGESLKVDKESNINFVPARDTVYYFFTENRNRKTIFHIQSGVKQFVTDADAIESLTASLFQATRKGKKVLLNKEGKPISALDFDLIVKTSAFQLALLKNKKFGLFDVHQNRLIKPEYDRNLEQLTPGYYSAYRQGKAGIIDVMAKPMVDFEFDDIQPWTDSVVWVRRGANWMLMNWSSRQVMVDRIKSFTIISSDAQEKLALIQKDQFYGVLSSSRGIVIPPTFNDVIDLGSEEEPLYFTEKRVEEADIYVVIYFDKNGKLVRKQVLEAEEYERIYCEDGSNR